VWCRWPVNALVAVVASAAADGHGDELQEVGAWHWLVALALLYRMCGSMWLWAPPCGC
jgi:hypothetical protein